MKTRARVLFVGQDTADATLLELVLAREMPGAEVEHIADAVAFGREIERGDFDLVVCDERFDWGGATRVLFEVRSRRPQATVVVLAKDDSPTASELGSGELAPAAREIALKKSSKAFLALPSLLRSTLERVAVEMNSARLEPRPRDLLERFRIGVFRLTLDGRLLEADETFLRVVGARTLGEAQRLDLSALTPKLPRGFTETGKVYKREQRLTGLGLEDPWVSLIEVVSLDEDGLPVLDGLLEDIADRKDVEGGLSVEATRLARSNEDLRMFASLAAHEMKEPLRTIEQSTRMLVEDVGPVLEGAPAESAELVVDGVRRLQSMIDGLLTLARFGGDEEWVEPCDCNQIVEEVLSALKARIEESGAKINVKALPSVHADPLQLRLVFRNLVSNAMKFHGEAPPRIRVAARQQDNDWLFSVEDEGIGVRPEEVERIFERFVRAASEPGAGLGLAICKEIVERHGGRIWVESEPPRGSTFYFTIPLSTSRKSRSPVDGDDESDGDQRREVQGESG